MTGTLQPLDSKFAIVDKFGNPTEYFTRWAQQRQIDIGNSIQLSDVQEYLTAHKFASGQGISLTPNGDLNNSPSISVLNGTGLDFDAMHNLKLADTAVTPGTYGDATHVPAIVVDQQGRITGVTLIAISGGGGAAWDFNPPSAASFSLVSGDATQLALTDDSNVGLIASYNSGGLGGQVQRCALRTLTNKTLDWTLTLKMKSLIPSINYRGNGILLYDSLSANNIGFQITTDSGLRVAKWTNLLGAGGVNLITINITNGTYVEWLRVVHTGGNYIFYVSENGKLWVEHSRVVDTAQMANRADKVGFSTYNWNAGAVTQMTVPYFTLTGPGV